MDSLNEAATAEELQRTTELAEFRHEIVPPFRRTDVAPKVSTELTRMQAMQARSVEHAGFCAVGAEFSTPELAAVQQAIRAALHDHFEPQANPATKLQRITPYTPGIASTPHKFLEDAAWRAFQVTDLATYQHHAIGVQAFALRVPSVHVS